MEKLIESSEEGQQKVDLFAKQKRIISNANGVQTTLHFEDNKAFTVKSWDAAPYLKAAAEARARNAGVSTIGKEHFMRRVGVIPAAQLSKMLAEGTLDDQAAIKKFFQENPLLAHDDKYLK